MKSLSISVAMATFNGARYLQEQLSDLAAQSVFPTELVVCDDRSTDDSLNILKRFAAEAPFPVHIHKNRKRLGYRANFMKASGLCRSDLIAFCDQDDRWLPHKLEVMRTAFDDPEVLLAFHGAELIDGDGESLGRFISLPLPAGGTPPLAAPPWALSPGFTQVFRRWLCDCDEWWKLSTDHRWELSESQDGPSEPLSHDQWYFFLAASLGTIMNVATPLVRYRQHGENVFGWPAFKPRFATRIVERMAAARWSPASRAQAARQRALILDLAANRLGPPYDRRANDAADAYRRLAKLCEIRASIHSEGGVGRRAAALLDLASAHGYSGKPWAFGLNALALDALIGIPRGLAKSERRPK